jgi:hypothetical protein
MTAKYIDPARVTVSTDKYMVTGVLPAADEDAELDAMLDRIEVLEFEPTTATVRVETFENMDSGFMPYTPGDRLVQRVTLRLPVTADGVQEVAWCIGNRDGEDADGQRWPSNVRSMSVGDVIHIVELDEWHAVASLGFESIERPAESSLDHFYAQPLK